MIIIIIYMYKKYFGQTAAVFAEGSAWRVFLTKKGTIAGCAPSCQLSHWNSATDVVRVFAVKFIHMDEDGGGFFFFYLFLRFLSSLSSPEKFSLLNLRRVAFPLTSSSPSPLQSFLLYFKSLKGIRSSLLNCGWIAALLIVSVNESAIHPLKWVIH